MAAARRLEAEGMERAIAVTSEVRLPSEHVLDLMRTGPARLLGDRRGGAGPAGLHAVLEVDAGAGTVVREQVELEVGELDERGDAASVAVQWRPAGHRRLFPSFTGELQVAPDGATDATLTLRGSYELPLGLLGAFGDGLGGRRLARRSLAVFVSNVARRIEADARPGWRPAPTAAVDLREVMPSDMYIG
jgi:hypothetical protein